MNIRSIFRLIVGVVFILSGFVKGVDPLGTAYRIEDYFIAYEMLWAMPLALFFSVSLCTLEFILGVALVLNLRLNLLSWVLFPLMIFFTLLTFYDALYEPVPDCGCFGDAIKLSNWETFYKNVVLIVLVAFIFKNRNKFKSILWVRHQHILLAVFVVLFTSFLIYQYMHLPLVDFREWKIGNDMSKEDSEEKTFLIYKNKASGETKEYLSPNYPWNDSVWMSQWEFVDQRIEVSGEQKHGLFILDEEGYDITASIIENPNYQFLLISWDMLHITFDQAEAINLLSGVCDENGISIVGLSGTPESEILDFTSEYEFDFLFYNADDITLKTMIRSNPGLILLKEGIVLDKWHYRDFPCVKELENLLELK